MLSLDGTHFMVVVPGVFSPSEIQQSVNFGYRVIKLFPASTLGIKYLNQVKSSIRPFPFIIAAGGMKVITINKWLKQGYNAIAIGRELTKSKVIDKNLKLWLKERSKN